MSHCPNPFDCNTWDAVSLIFRLKTSLSAVRGNMAHCLLATIPRRTSFHQNLVDNGSIKCKRDHTIHATTSFVVRMRCIYAMTDGGGRLAYNSRRFRCVYVSYVSTVAFRGIHKFIAAVCPSSLLRYFNSAIAFSALFKDSNFCDIPTARRYSIILNRPHSLLRCKRCERGLILEVFKLDVC